MITREDIPTYLTQEGTHWKFYYRGVRCESWLDPSTHTAEYEIEVPENFPENNIPTLAKSVVKEQMCERDDITCSKLEFTRR